MWSWARQLWVQRQEARQGEPIGRRQWPNLASKSSCGIAWRNLSRTRQIWKHDNNIWRKRAKNTLQPTRLKTKKDFQSCTLKPLFVSSDRMMKYDWCDGHIYLCFLSTTRSIKLINCVRLWLFVAIANWRAYWASIILLSFWMIFFRKPKVQDQ